MIWQAFQFRRDDNVRLGPIKFIDFFQKQYKIKERLGNTWKFLVSYHIAKTRKPAYVKCDFMKKKNRKAVQSLQQRGTILVYPPQISLRFKSYLYFFERMVLLPLIYTVFLEQCNTLAVFQVCVTELIFLMDVDKCM